MNRCPITLLPCEDDYSRQGMHLLSPRLQTLHELPYTVEELRQEAALRADKMSFQGVQPKLSARLNTTAGRFELVDRGGRYILKPQVTDYREVPENEAVSMRLAGLAGIEVPLHGLLYGRDRRLTYFIRRFDRSGRNDKVHVEDFAQLSERSRATKYRSSMEQIAALIEHHCTFPAVDKLRLFRRTLFCFLIGNEDMHLKNFSLLRQNDIICLAPAYDLLNTTIVLPHPKEELALPLNGKKNNLQRSDLIEYYACERLRLTPRVIGKVLAEFQGLRNQWIQTIADSFLSDAMRQRYVQLLNDRFQRISGDDVACPRVGPEPDAKKHAS
ncbi:MAG: phosphatidylinositol kinase [Desulfobulbaceae bacterium A2]|nr:MAG: phosphatidylinositol kinase [Desulfobulbaceae bacterium A2]